MYMTFDETATDLERFISSADGMSLMGLIRAVEGSRLKNPKSLIVVKLVGASDNSHQFHSRYTIQTKVQIGR